MAKLDQRSSQQRHSERSSDLDRQDAEVESLSKLNSLVELKDDQGGERRDRTKTTDISDSDERMIDSHKERRIEKDVRDRKQYTHREMSKGAEGSRRLSQQAREQQSHHWTRWTTVTKDSSDVEEDAGGVGERASSRKR